MWALTLRRIHRKSGSRAPATAPRSGADLDEPALPGEPAHACRDRVAVEPLSFRSADGEVGVLAGEVVAGEVADERVVAGRELEGHRFCVARLEVAGLADVAGLVRAAVAQREVR